MTREFTHALLHPWVKIKKNKPNQKTKVPKNKDQTKNPNTHQKQQTNLQACKNQKNNKPTKKRLPTKKTKPNKREEALPPISPHPSRGTGVFVLFEPKMCYNRHYSTQKEDKMGLAWFCQFFVTTLYIYKSDFWACQKNKNHFKKIIAYDLKKS